MLLSHLLHEARLWFWNVPRTKLHWFAFEAFEARQELSPEMRVIGGHEKGKKKKRCFQKELHVSELNAPPLQDCGRRLGAPSRQ